MFDMTGIAFPPARFVFFAAAGSRPGFHGSSSADAWRCFKKIAPALLRLCAEWTPRRIFAVAGEAGGENDQNKTPLPPDGHCIIFYRKIK